MQKEFLIDTKLVTDEKGTPLSLRYCLIEDISSAARLYGICIKKSTAGRPDTEETERTPLFSDSEEQVFDLLGKLIRSSVTPACLLEVLDEQMSAAF